MIVTVGGDPTSDFVPLPGIALPGLANAHSHAFHRLLRGRTHRQGGDFWDWREGMYRLADRLDPDTYEELATAVYVEMAQAGVTAVGEFHYLHHQPDGDTYEDPNEMAHALIRAARAAGIRISLLDVGYLRAGFDDPALHPVQRRFSDGSADRWLDRVAALSDFYRGDADVVVGLAPHSVRALTADDLRVMVARAPEAAPIHIHVSEQLAENEACLRATGRTPVGLLHHVGALGTRTTLVHATHLSEADIELVGDTDSRVCYCATTERDLADGIGPGGALSHRGVELCVGSDSHALIDLFEEARGIEMHERLVSGHRGVISPVDLASAATVNGHGSLGLPVASLAPGAPADFIVLDTGTPRLAGLDLSGPIDQVIFAASPADVVDVFVAGRRIVSHGSHPRWDAARTGLEVLSKRFNAADTADT